MKSVLMITALLGLTACASTQSVLSDEPKEVFFSERSVNEVSFCLANKNNTSPLDQDDGSKVVLIKNGWGGVALAFTIFPDPAGSRVEYRKKFGIIGPIWKQCLGDPV